MQFQDLPELLTTPYDETLILVGSEGELYQTENLFNEVNDLEIVRLVLSKVTPSQQLDNHVADQSIHTKIADTLVSPNTTWSSARISTAITGSSPWFNLDSVPEGTVNRYFTEERAKEIVAATTQGVPVLDHRAIATQIVSVLLGFNNSTFRYRRSSIPDYLPSISVLVDGAAATVNFFDVKPGVRNLQFNPPPSGGEMWVCDELVHVVTISSNGSQQITPKLTLDAFIDGTVNKFWNTINFANSPLVQSINNHLSGDTFKSVHARINDNSTGSFDTTWSSNKIINYVSSEIAKNRTAVAASAKTVLIGHETALSGQSASGYQWETATAGTIHTHYITRNPNNQIYNSGNGTYIYSEFSLSDGTWMVYWEADITLKTGVFASVTNPSSYIALSTTPRVAVLTTPGIITVSGYNVSYRLVSKFSTTTPYNSSFQNNWLQPQSVAGVNELYAIVHIERVR